VPSGAIGEHWYKLHQTRSMTNQLAGLTHRRWRDPRFGQTTKTQQVAKEGVLPEVSDMLGPEGQTLLDAMKLADAYQVRVALPANPGGLPALASTLGGASPRFAIVISQDLRTGYRRAGEA
jgi:hypothetical protein